MPRRLRIAFVYDALYPYVIGGAERRYHELAKRLAMDHEVHRYSWSYWRHGDPRPTPGVRYHGVGRPLRFYGSDGRRRIAEALAFALRLAPRLAGAQLDVIDCASMPYFPALTAQICARANGAALVVTWHEYWEGYWRRYLGGLAPAGAAVERLSTLAGDLQVAVSPYTARKLRASALGEVPIAVVPNGVDLEVLGAIQPAPQPCDVVSLGRLIREKRVDLLLRALALLLPRYPELRCTVIGEGPVRAELERLAAELHLEEHLTFTGFLEERAALRTLKAGSVCVLPSEREGFGMVVLESQAMGVPPVVAESPESAATDLVEDGRTGLVCSASPPELAAAIDRLLASPRLREALAANAREEARSYSWDSIASRMEALYRAAVRRKRDGHSIQALPRYRGGEQAATPLSSGAAARRQAAGPGL